MLRIIWCGSDPNKPLGVCRKKLANLISMIGCYMCVISLGFCCVTTVKKKITDYDPDYPEPTAEDLKIKPCLIVCNHIGVVEAYIIGHKFSPG